MRDLYSIKNVQVRQIYTQNGIWLPAYDGCDYAHGNENCYECIKRITNMFFKNPDLDTSETVTPINIEDEEINKKEIKED
jgi:hypothetical protein